MQALERPPSTAELWERFTRKAEQLGAVVLHASTETAAAALLSSTHDGAPTGTDSLARRLAIVAARCAPLPERAPTAEVVAAGVLAIAETGSVLLAEDNRGRGACFLADRLWLLVAATDVVPTLEAGLARVGALVGAGSRHVVLVSGPSRTADIERTLTIGVHGPVGLTIVVVGDAGPSGATPG